MKTVWSKALVHRFQLQVKIPDAENPALTDKAWRPIMSNRIGLWEGESFFCAFFQPNSLSKHFLNGQSG